MVCGTIGLSLLWVEIPVLYLSLPLAWDPTELTRESLKDGVRAVSFAYSDQIMTLGFLAIFWYVLHLANNWVERS